MEHVKRINLLLFLMLAFSLILIGWVDLVWWQKAVLIFVIFIVYGYVIINGFKMRKTELQLEELESTKQKMIYDIQVAADRLSGVMEEVNRHILGLQQSADLSQEREISLQEKSGFAKERIETAFEKMNHVTETARQLHELMDQMDEGMTETKGVVAEVAEYLHTTDRVMEVLTTSNHLVQEKIGELIRHLSSIEELNHFLVKIAGETSMLSINASIEAARTGEQGKGFTVVASRMKQLANQSKEALERSSSLIEEVTGRIQEVTEAVEKEKEGVKRGLSVIADVKRNINLILNSVIQVNEKVERAVGAVYKQEEMIQKTAVELQSAVEIINETIKMVGLTLTQVKEQRGQINALKDVNSNLLKESEELKQSISSHMDKKEILLDSIAEKLEHMKNSLLKMTKKPEILSLDPDLHANLLKSFLKEHPDLSAIWSNRADGTFIFSEPAAGLLNAKQREWWQGAMREGFFVSKVYISAITKLPCITVAAAITNSAGEKIGVLGVDLSV